MRKRTGHQQEDKVGGKQKLKQDENNFEWIDRLIKYSIYVMAVLFAGGITVLIGFFYFEYINKTFNALPPPRRN